jgi:uncharacterized protein (DUF934 family)
MYMALIKDRKRALDTWQLLEGEADCAASVPATGEVIVSLPVWHALRDALIARGRVGVWLGGDAEPAAIAGDLQHFGVVAVRFASFTDGRGYSIGRLLRERYGWSGELRAIGDVQRDQLYYLLRCGFDAFALRDGEDVDTALTAFDDFTEAYQSAVDRPHPLFRRRELARTLS